VTARDRVRPTGTGCGSCAGRQCQIHGSFAPKPRFSAALEAYADLTLTGRDTLELLQKAPDPESAAKLSAAQIAPALKRAGRRGDLQERAREIRAALRAPHLGQPDVMPGHTPPPCRPAPP
jgi:hypothetical protein